MAHKKTAAIKNYHCHVPRKSETEQDFVRGSLKTEDSVFNESIARVHF